MVAVNLDKLKELVSRFKQRPSDVVGLDIAHSCTKAVRLRRQDGELVLMGADILPVVSVPRKPDEQASGAAPMGLPRQLAGKYASFSISSPNAIVKLLSFPGHAAEGIEGKILEGMAIENPDRYRISYKTVVEGHGKAEFRALAVAVPDCEAAAACALLPVGLPVPYSVEVSGLAVMSAFLAGPAAAHAEDAVGMLEFGARVSFFAIFNKRLPVLLRKFDLGSDLILEKVQESLGIDRTTAQGILSDGSFDISQQMSEVLDPFIKQIVVSRDFVERRENCRVGKIFASGGIASSRDWRSEMKGSLGHDVDTWNPFDIVKVPDDSYPEHLKGQETRFAAAIGACVVTLMEGQG